MKFADFAGRLHDHRNDARFGFQFKQGSERFVDNLLALLFPHFCTERLSSADQIEARIVLLEGDLTHLLGPLVTEKGGDPAALAHGFMATLPLLHGQIMSDAAAINQGDPAAESLDEVILAYPGFTAIAIYRFAHEFYKRQVPIFPRLLTEYAHHLTGIDIHPGATIGEGFAIDHGTGIVIGESTVIFVMPSARRFFIRA